MRRRAKLISTRRAKDWDGGLYVSYCPRSNSRLTQYPSGVRKLQQNRYEIGGLSLHESLTHHLSDFPAYVGDQDEISGLKAAPPMSRRYCFPSNLIKSVAAYAFLRASSSVSPSAVTPRTRPPAV